ncbi:MAG: succinylglutamate desuccinylase/aspartoacylase family protein [Acidobacteriota bacterium]|nr:succinylglutamate desuccinylase/aspartoacylase family protein [Acidobacteriota bacterium]
MPESIAIGGKIIAPGESDELELRVARLPTGDWLSLPTVILNGQRKGPGVWLDAAIHGDELNGLEIIRRVLAILDPAKLAGQVLAVPIVNVFGFVQQTRYLPDRRDLNRSFPGSARGSLASRIAHLFMTEIVDRCLYGLDFHTGSLHRTNLPQVRGALDDPETLRIGRAFGAPVLLSAAKIKGSLRQAAGRRGAHVLVYEAGEPLRFDEQAIQAGVQGTLGVLAALGMWDSPAKGETKPFEASATRWLRASRSGVFHRHASLGDRVAKQETIGRISDVLGHDERPVKASIAGMVIGYTNNPLVHQGDALIHLANLEKT